MKRYGVTTSYGSGRNHGKMRWVVVNENGTVVRASEYVRDDESGRKWVAEMIPAVQKDLDAGVKPRDL